MASLSASKHLILCCHITGTYDVNRSNILPDDDYSLVKEWADSVIQQGLKGIIFHNNFSEDTCQRHQNKHINFVKVNYDPAFKPNVYRYLVYQDFLHKHTTEIESVFVTDVSDVVVLQNPIIDPFFTTNPNMLFCGDEPKTLDNEWMINHSTHLRSKIRDYASYEEKFKEATLLNCGIIGGHIGVIKPFIQQLAHIHRQYNHDNFTAYTGDMGAFNYLARTQFNTQICHGQPVNTVFKGYETHRKDCWFRHK